MSRPEQSNRFFIVKAIREYYSRKPLEEPLYLPKREIAIYSLEDRAYIRHLSFPSMSKLYDFILREKTPLHLYYSSAYYENPSSDKMELKGWLGSDLLFDIDSDKYPGCDKHILVCVKDNRIINSGNCPGGDEPIKLPIIPEECIKRAFYDVVKLYTVLRDELGFKNISIYFSGNRGFHVKVSDDSVLSLSSEERREIVSYILLEKIDLTRLFPLMGKRNKYTLLHERREYGVRGRILRLLKAAGSNYERFGDYIKLPYEELETFVEEAKIKIDPVVTIDTSRLSRFGYSLNCKAGLVVKPLDMEKITNISYTDFNPWEGEVIVKGRVDLDVEVLKEKVSIRRSEAIALKTHIALYLALYNLVDIIKIRELGVKRV
ncbi:MAG: DNA primase small subunit domain-containing protein [Thermoprotei archaeon]